MNFGCNLHICDYYLQRKDFQNYLLNYLSIDRLLRVLYLVNYGRPVSHLIDDGNNEGVIDLIYRNDPIDSNFEEHYNSFVFDYDIIFRNLGFFSENVQRVLSKRKFDFDSIKKMALKIAKNENKRVSVGFICCCLDSEIENDFDYYRKYIFYSTNSDGKVFEVEVDMSDTHYFDSEFLGKVIFMHNSLVKQEKCYVKSIGGLK